MIAAWLLIVGAALSEQQAKQIVPRADLSGLDDAQRGAFVNVAVEVFNYAGCQDTLAKCLAANVKDPHALRMAALVKALLLDGGSADQVIKIVEDYYASFDPKGRVQPQTDNCAVLGKGPVAIVEFSDYQCPHCAAAVGPLHELVTKEASGKARLCAKYFPFPSHPRARIAAGCAEYARGRGKFWPVHEAIFAHQGSLEDEDLKTIAASLKLDGAEMLKQVYAGKFDAIIEKHIREGTAAGVDHTPMLYFNGRVYNLPDRLFYLLRSVEDELEWSKRRGFVFDKARRT